MQCPRCREGVQYENTTDRPWCPNCGTSVSSYDAALMADYGWTRARQTRWSTCPDCGVQTTFEDNLGPGDYPLMDCGHAFISAGIAGIYIVSLEPPE